MKKIVAAVVGCGVIAPTHAESLKLVPGVECRYAVDLIPERAEKLRDRFGFTRAIVDFREALRDPEVNLVCVCTEHAAHAEIVVAALDAGKHVVCEKPLGSENAQLDEMLAAAARHPELVFGGIFQHRHDPKNQLVKRLLEQGAFGRVLFVNLVMNCLRTDDYYRADAWRGTWAREGGGAIINQAIHHLDLLRFWFGEVDSVAAAYENFAHRQVSETEDTDAILIKFDAGMFGTAAITNASAVDWRSRFTISGTEGCLELQDEVPVFLKFRDPACETAVHAEFDALEQQSKAEAGKSYYGTGHPAQLADVIAAIRENRAPFVPAAVAAGTVRLVKAAYRAAETRTWVKP